MPKYNTKKTRRQRRHKRVRRKIVGTAERPRFCVSFTANNIYVQFIDDEKGHTVAATSTLDPAFKEQNANAKANMEGAELLGKIAGEKAVSAGIVKVVFDRGGFQYHGRVKALADSARKAGLKF